MKFLLFVLIPFFNCARNTDTLYCEHPEVYAQPKNGYIKTITALTELYTPIDISEELSATFYLCATVLKNGKVIEISLVKTIEGKSTICSTLPVEEIEPWLPAISNGETCNQKLRLKTLICLRN